MKHILMTAMALRLKIRNPEEGLRILDVRHDLANHGLGRELYLEGHIPGAIFLDHETDLCAPKTGMNGRHPLPSHETFAQFIMSKGLSPDDHVVVYDSDNMMFAAHVWMMLRWIGFERISILSHGFKAWSDIMGETESGMPPDLPAVSWELRPSQVGMVDAVQVEQNIPNKRFTLVDARLHERYTGAVEPMDPVGGHIPGALNRPFMDNLDAEGYFKPAEQLCEEFLALKKDFRADQIVHQCGSGITACHNLLAMELAGLSGSRIYPGSWSEWVSDCHRPIAVGE